MFFKCRGLSALLLLGLVGLASCSGAGEPVGSSDEGAETASLRLAQTVPITSSEYKLDAIIDPDILDDRFTELWARVYRPATLEDGQRYPLIVLLHGNHHTCGTGSNPRVDDDSTYTTTGDCPPMYVVVPSHKGYAYLAEAIAAEGYIVVSINANRGITGAGAPGVPGDSGLNLARGRLVLKHLTTLSEWDRGVAPTPPELGVDLTGHLDFGEVGLMGHSRGGEGMRAAFAQYRDPGSPWPARIVTPVEFRGIFEVGPVDGQTSRVLDVRDIKWSVILPMCDADVENLAGIRPFDRSFTFLEENPPSFKASLTVWGANHNYYNSEWQESESSGCREHDPIFMTGPGVIGSEPQRETGRILMSAFFLGNVGEQADPTENSLFDPLNGLPPALTSITRVERGFTLSPDTRVTLRLEDFLNAAGTSSFSLPNVHSNVSVTHGPLLRHDSSLRNGTILWTSSGSNTFFQTNFAPVGSGLSLETYGTLDLRLERQFNTELNPPGPTNFTVQLVDSQDMLSTPVEIAEFVELIGPVGGPNLIHRMLQTARIPVPLFEPTPLDSIRGVRLTFDQTASGVIHVANIRATRQTCTETPELDLKVRQVARSANEVQYRFQVFNQQAAPISLSDLSVRLWISDPASNIVSQVFYGGRVLDGTGAFQFDNIETAAGTTRIEPACEAAPDRIADWAATIEGADARLIPGNGGAWVDGQFVVRRADFGPFGSFDDDYSQTPAYQGVVSDAIWPTVYGDDVHFVLYHQGMPVAEFVAPTTADPVGGEEPSCLPSCVNDVQDMGFGSGFVASSLPPATPLRPSAGSSGGLMQPVSSGSIVNLVRSSRRDLPGAIDLEVQGDSPFPLRNELPVLRGGDVEVTLSRYPDPHNLHRLTFSLTPEEFAALRDGESLSVQYGDAGARWDVGVLNKSRLAP